MCESVSFFFIFELVIGRLSKYTSSCVLKCLARGHFKMLLRLSCRPTLTTRCMSQKFEGALQHFFRDVQLGQCICFLIACNLVCGGLKIAQMPMYSIMFVRTGFEQGKFLSQVHFWSVFGLSYGVCAHLVR